MSFRFWKYYLTCCLCLTAFLAGAEPAYTVIQDQGQIQILTPSLAQRQTLKLRLSNGLEVYLMSDPEAVQAGAVLTVKAGSWDDPDQYPGLAHFLEHMLFLGTEKYPIESDYDHFIRKHNGKSNAYTASDYTLYLFSIDPEAFEEGLDRFSFFFKKPLFNPSGVGRELHAIDQEFAKDFNQDHTREYYVSKELANSRHPFHRFSIGNSTTLSKVTPEILKEWYQTHYGANKMRLIVYGPHSLDTLRSWVIENFKDISSISEEFHPPTGPALTEEMQGKVVYIEPKKNTKTLRLTWELPESYLRLMSFKPENFICSLLKQEGSGSLMASLKAEGLANGLSCRSYHLAKQHLIFSLSIQLTEEGLEKISQVIEKSFQAIQVLQQQDVPSYLFDEFKKINLTRFQYQSREETFDYLMNLGGMLVYEDLSSFPESVLIPHSFDPNLMREFLSNLTPQRAHFTVLARHPALTFDQKEQWLGTPYHIASFSPEQLQNFAHSPLDPHLHFPTPNPFIPQNLKLVHELSHHQKSSSFLPHPLLLINDARAKIYFAADDRFQLPQTMWFFEIKTPSIESSDPAKVVLADLYLKCLNEILQPISYSAQLADLSYDISRTSNGILFTLSGYHDKAEVLFDLILEHLTHDRPSQKLFQNFKHSLLNQYLDFNQESPLKQGFETYRHLLFKFHSTSEQRVKALEALSYDQFLNFIDHLYDQTFIEGLLYGNVNQKQALHLYNKLQTRLSSQIFPSEQRLIERILVLPSQSGPYVMDWHVQSSGNAAILGIENEGFSFKSRAAQQILAQAMNSAFYSTLRTQQQTCYLLFSRSEEFDKHLFSFFGVQSTTHDPRDLLARFELFIESFLQEMEKNGLTKEQFEAIRHSLINSLENSPQNLSDTGYLIKTLAFKYEGDFDWMNKRIQGFKDLTYEELLNMAREFLGKQNKRRLAILIRGTEDSDFHYHVISSPDEMRSQSQYTSQNE